MMLKVRAVTATLWGGAELLLRQGVQFVAVMVLARLLTPSDFGVIAMLSIVVGIAGVLWDGGFSAALIQRQQVSHVDESTVFWCNLGVGALLALTLCGAAPFIADFYRLPILEPLTRVMALVVLFGALGAIHSTLLTRQLDFRTQAKVSVLASILSAVVAIALAWQGFGVWSLAAQSVVFAVTATALLWWLHRWRPALRCSRESLYRLSGFGGYHLGSSLLEVIYSRLYTLILGRLYGAHVLGLYNNAEVTKQMPVGFIGGLLARVALPMFSAVAGDVEMLRRGVQLSVRGLMLLSAPVLLGIVALAEPLVLLMFGRQWLASVPILRILCIAGLLYPLHAINLHALMAQGHSRLMFRLELAKKTIGILLIALGSMYGVMGIAWSQVAFSLIAFGINTRFTGRFLDFGAWAQLREFTPPLLAAILMACCVYGVSLYWAPSPAQELAGLTAMGVLVFLALVRIARLKAFYDVLAFLREGVMPQRAGTDSASASASWRGK
ncbi:MAG: lipopolysaccharide biosynthesis protein [Gammaproteobacteria bacterium]|nr:lipopolysaccharide biosynthesis protein [Gammaproteobacteria bacterium]